MKKQHVNRWTSLWLALIMVLVSILGPVPAVMAQDFDPAEPALVVDAAATVPDAEMAEEEAAQVELPAEDEALPVDEVVEAAAEEIVGAGGLTDFSSPQGGLTIDEEAGTVTLSDIDDNHYAVYNGLEEEVNSFTLEADVMFKEDQDTNCAALTSAYPAKALRVLVGMVQILTPDAKAMTRSVSLVPI